MGEALHWLGHVVGAGVAVAAFFSARRSADKLLIARSGLELIRNGSLMPAYFAEKALADVDGRQPEDVIPW